MFISKYLLNLLLLLCIRYACSARRKAETLTLGERVERLMDLSKKKGIIRLDGDLFRQYIGLKALPRNYSFIVMMTALSPKRQCHVCGQAYEEYSIVANSWRHSPHFSNKLFFGLIDYDEDSEIFTYLGINSAPVFIYFSEKGKIKGAEQMDIMKIGFVAEMISKWVSEKTGIQIRIIRPPNYSGNLALLIICALIGALLYTKRNNLDFLYNRNPWAVVSLSIVFAMTSGQMWNHIRGPPLMHHTNKGTTYIHRSSGGQFVIETYIVFILNAAIAFGMILMNDAMKGEGDHKKRKILAIIGFSLMAFFFSLLLSVFRSKAHGYPYSFLIK